MPITPKQECVLNYIKNYMIGNDGVAPTIGEIGRQFQMKSPASVHAVLVILEQQGRIRRTPNVARGIVLIESPRSSFGLPASTV